MNSEEIPKEYGCVCTEQNRLLFRLKNKQWKWKWYWNFNTVLFILCHTQ